MKTIQSGFNFRIYDDSMKVYDYLPPQVYKINFSQNDGFSLSIAPEVKIKEKIYGSHEQKAVKVLNFFSHSNRNLGVILSGEKGIGKSLFAKLLIEKAITENNLPVIIVNSNFNRLADYINSIEQEVMVVFDEFEKIFKDEEFSNSQNNLLSLFDGLSSGKKLFVITCNEIENLSKYLLGRPGRFHYHFRFKCPRPQEIKEYLLDQLKLEQSEKYKAINKVIELSKRIKLSYDILRAIATELNINTNEEFEGIIEDLNLPMSNQKQLYDFELLLSDESILKLQLNIARVFPDNDTNEKGNKLTIVFEDEKIMASVVNITFNNNDIIYNEKYQKYYIDGKKLKAVWTHHNDGRYVITEQTKQALKDKYENLEIKGLLISLSE